jgi:hypothetical protein
MSGFTFAWCAWWLIFAIIEGVALFNRQEGDTLSEHIRKWFKVKDPRPTGLTWFFRAVLMTVLIWFITHFFFEWPW